MRPCGHDADQNVPAGRAAGCAVDRCRPHAYGKVSTQRRGELMSVGPREIVVPYRPIPLTVPEGMKPNEFFNSAENLADLVHNNGLLSNPEGLLLYRKALGHSGVFDTSIIYNTSQALLDPLGRPVRRTQVPNPVRHVWD